jgi:hypothetical protein
VVVSKVLKVKIEKSDVKQKKINIGNSQDINDSCATKVIEKKSPGKDESMNEPAPSITKG